MNQPLTPAAPVAKHSRVEAGLKFFGQFLRNPAAVGAIVPSSRYLARVLVGPLDLAPGELVVEYGPGTGPVTATIAANLPKQARYLGIELQQKFVEMLQQRHAQLAFHHGSAADVCAILAARGLPAPKLVVSGLPFASLPEAVQDEVVAGLVAVLRESGGEFRTFQYLHAFGMKAARRFRALMAEHFTHSERIGPVLRNVPPAFVLRYWGAR